MSVFKPLCGVRGSVAAALGCCSMSSAWEEARRGGRGEVQDGLGHSVLLDAEAWSRGWIPGGGGA